MSDFDTEDLIGDILVDESEKEVLRKELTDFLEDFRYKKNDEGKPIIHFPKNFDQISNAMTRQDLISTEDKTWSKYLLEERFDQDSKKCFEGGRYSDLVEETEGEAMVHRGLAEIHMLDKQINSLNLQAKKLPSSTPRSRSTGYKKSKLDSSTFITGAASVNGDDSNLNTARSNMSISSESSNISTPKSTARQRRFSVQSCNEEMTDGDICQDAKLSTESVVDVDADIVERQRNAELRLEALLNMGEDEECETGVWQSLSRYGYTEDSHKRIQDIDRELADIQSKSLPLGSHISEEVSSSIYSLCDEDLRNSMGNETRFPPLPGEGLRSSAQKEDADINSPDKKVRKEKKENILQKQRATRLMKEYEKKIDDLIYQVHNEELNISGLVAVSSTLECPAPPSSLLPPIEVQSSSHSSRCTSTSGKVGRSTTLPPATTSITNRVITMQDVQGIIGELCYSQSQMSESTNISNTLAERLKMDRLLAQIKSDVTRLAVERLELRESLLDTHPHDPYKLGFTDSTEGLHYSSLLQEYLLEFASENDEISNIVNQQSAAFREHDKHSDFASHCTSDGNASPQEDVIYRSCTSTAKQNELGALSRMTTLELKEANKKNTSSSFGVGSDQVKLQTIIHGILAKQSASSKSNATTDETVFAINLEHVHDKIQAILNRVKCVSESGDYVSEGDIIGDNTADDKVL